MAVWLTGPRRQWAVLGSFIPRLYSGTLISRLFGLKILLTLTLGSRNHFIPESPFPSDDRLLRQKIMQILLDISRDPVPTTLQFLTTDTNGKDVNRLYPHPQLLLLLQVTPNTLRYSENPLCL